MNPIAFSKIAESLRQYRRAELKDFQNYVEGNVMDRLYVDPLRGNAVLQTVLSNNTTFLIGRKDTGKSTVFAKAQADILVDGEKIVAISFNDALTSTPLFNNSSRKAKRSDATPVALVFQSKGVKALSSTGGNVRIANKEHAN